MTDKIKSAKMGTVKMSTKAGLESKIPDGAKILDKDITINVEEIENGFLITKNIYVKYQMKGKEYTDSCYHDVKYFSETNPVAISEETKKEEPSLADLFN